ncbi:hypothetical protein D3C80_1395960 [compost metagenome]
MVHRHGRAFGIDACGRQDDVDLLAGGKTLRAFGGVAEGEAGAGNVVDPALQLRVDVEVDQASCQHDSVGGQQFGSELVRQFGGSRFLGITLVSRLADSRGRYGVEMGNRILTKVVTDNSCASVLRLQLIDEFVGDLGREGFVAARAGGDEKNGRHRANSLICLGGLLATSICGARLEARLADK